MDQPLSQWEQLIQNISVGPHLPLLEVPPVYTGDWTEGNWARWMGLTIEEFRLVQTIERRRP